ncbi:MAG: type II toxin-antitoxin system VapC family toxin [Candidatus Accumulibacter sp.]|jgi:predicted nucleic-acid-binding protein|nr:type II toxin-antitoxin system VapC family toxin [Accumulibacter sp.]
MIGLDTNVLVRYLAQDDVKQAALANALMDSLTDANPGFVSLVVLVETVWVLESRYGANADKIAQVLETLLHIGSLAVDQAETVWRSLRRFKTEGGDFSDTLIAMLAHDRGCAQTYTFDKGAARYAGMVLLK